MKNITIILIIFVSFYGCIHYDIELNETYHKFNNDDENLIINYNYEVDQIITYKNQFNEEIHFKVTQNQRKKRGKWEGNWVTSSTFSHYYESKIIRLEIVENEANYGDEVVHYIFSKSYNKFKNGINFPIWNVNYFSFIDEIQEDVNLHLRDYNGITKVEMNINGHLFQKVITLNSGSDLLLSGSLGAMLPNSINKLYYDYEFGVIQFNDIDGKEWKIIYPN